MSEDRISASNREFFEIILDNHSSVSSWSLMSEDFYEVFRVPSFGDSVLVHLSGLYVLSYTEFLAIRKRLPTVQAVALATPFCSYTDDAKKLAVADGVGLFNQKEIMGALNYKKIVEYTKRF